MTGTTAEQSDLNAYICQDGSGPAAGTWSVSHSTFSDGTSQSGYGYGIYLDSTAGSLTFNTDTISNNPGEGFAASSVSDVTLESSIANNNGGDGIYIGGPGGYASTASTGNTVSGNTANKNGGDGIFADTLSSGNTFTGNITKKNLTYDLQDLSGGPNGPVLNTWSGNTCKPANDSSPSGLCG